MKRAATEDGVKPERAAGPRKPSLPRWRPFKRVSLVDSAVARLREHILRGDFRPDGALPSEGRLAEMFGVSRTVIREAMRILSAQGLVEISQGCTARVRSSDPQTVVDAFHTYMRRENHTLLDLTEVRLPLESSIASLAAVRASAEQIDKMEQCVERLAAARDLGAQIDADMRFHDVLAEATRNPVFALLLKTVVGLMRQSRSKTLARVGVRRALEGHRAILAAVRRRDPDQAQRAMSEHLSMARDDLTENSP